MALYIYENTGTSDFIPSLILFLVMIACTRHAIIEKITFFLSC